MTRLAEKLMAVAKFYERFQLDVRTAYRTKLPVRYIYTAKVQSCATGRGRLINFVRYVNDPADQRRTIPARIMAYPAL
jgi:hypothetical protein